MVREHSAMLNCEHKESDQIGPCCLMCGRIDFDPSLLVLGLSAAYLAYHIVRLGLKVAP